MCARSRWAGRGQRTAKKGENVTDGGRHEFEGFAERLGEYAVYDKDGERIGGIEDLFLDEVDRPEYVGIRVGLTGAVRALVPIEVARVDEGRRAIYLPVDRRFVEGGPTFDDEREVTSAFEREVHAYYNLDGAAEDRAAYGDYYPGEEAGGREGSVSTGATGAGTVGAGMSMGDTEHGAFEEHGMGQEGPGRDDDKSDHADEDELRVQRSEEELRAGTRERQAGAMRVRKRVRTDRERIEVPTRHEEVTVERVPVSGEATEAQIGEEEVEVPVTEEEVVTDKRTVAKEEVRLRKESVEDTEVVEDDVRREEIDVEDATERGRGTGV